MDEIFAKYIGPEDAVLVALSGGPDSVYLLDRLRAYRSGCPFLLEAAHLHHGLREEAEEDLSFVRDLCDRWQIPLYVERADVSAYARAAHLGIEEAGRVLRYDFLRRHKRPGGMIALGHHLDDQAETLLFRLIRGTGPEGMVGMRVREGDLFRPLLFTRKAEIIAYLEAANIPYVTDATNEAPIYARNKIRLEILPAAESINEGFVESLERFRRMIQADAEYLRAAAHTEFHRLAMCKREGLFLSKAVFDLPASLADRVLRMAAEKMRGDLQNIGYEHIRSLYGLRDAESGKGIDLPGVRIRSSYDALVFEWQGQYAAPTQVVPLKDGAATFDGHRFFITEDRHLPYVYIRDPGDIRIRTRRPGDRIAIRGGMKKIKDVFIDAKIDRGLRDRWPLVVEGEEVVWVPGLRKAYRQEEKGWKKLAWRPSKKA
ncbi:tRNA(Ile)-lysidine synthase [Peptoniphilus ivorii]|uniref:tRNA lysidine(34) synthetase TilS n=1 Tax=Aedoeadaptatus ivorii TaxID=54006 RepID=UPI0027802065|nr:tRNA lysidine(34) synthetase TilS [Peptoniphilus ivorii]MDQ0509059.1 tRNA(Ile)-lysidine synthase [Peptoniphilus ivorii]